MFERFGTYADPSEDAISGTEGFGAGRREFLESGNEGDLVGQRLGPSPGKPEYEDNTPGPDKNHSNEVLPYISPIHTVQV